jgi:ABC-2 type transport system permease protein
VSVFALQSVLRLHGEEAALRAEPLLATPVGRRAWAGSHLLVAALGSVWLLLVAGAGMGLTAAMSLHDGSWFPRLLAGQLQQAAAVLVMIGIAAACFGLVPRLVTAGWAFLVGFLLLGELGPVFSLDRRVLDVSPFEHVPRLGTSGVGSLVALLAVAAVLVVAGVEGFRRRDVG